MVLDLGGSAPARPGRAAASGRIRRIDQRSDPGIADVGETGLLYERVVALVEQLIADRGMAPGDRLPRYAELAELAGVSMITVRRALDELERAGRVRRHQGLGTFVARPRRLRLLDGTPAVLETSMIPIVLAPELDQMAGRLTGSLYDLLASEYGLADAFEEQYLEVIGPTKGEAKLLGLRGQAQAVRIRGLSATAAGLPFDCFEQLYSADQFAFAISGSASRRLLPVPGQLDWGIA